MHFKTYMRNSEEQVNMFHMGDYIKKTINQLLPPFYFSPGDSLEVQLRKGHPESGNNCIYMDSWHQGELGKFRMKTQPSGLEKTLSNRCAHARLRFQEKHKVATVQNYFLMKWPIFGEMSDIRGSKDRGLRKRSCTEHL